jgi:hypothetical protein
MDILASPFARSGRWFKGQLHVHSTVSDGGLSPESVLNWYRNQGYHFVALTDHDMLSKSQTIADDFITLSGIEVQGIDPTAGLFHLVGLGMQKPPELGGSTTLSMQETVNQLRAAGALVGIAHPYWSGQMSKDLLGVTGCFALEVYNGGCEVLECKGLSVVHWDDLLAAGCRLWGLAVDDAHWRPGTFDAGLGWVWVKAATLTQPAILSALAQGHFYASSGPRIDDIVIEGDRILVRCSPVVAVDFVGSGPLNFRVLAVPGETLTEASHQLKKWQQYVRVAVHDAQGRWAWANPILVDERDQV